MLVLNNMKRIILTLSLIVIAALGCNFFSMEDVPSEEFIKQWKDAQAFIIEPIKITGIYKDMDVGAVVFKYTTAANKDKLWTLIQSNLKETKWKLVSESSNARDYERCFAKGDQSPDRPDMAMFSSAELMKIEYVPNKQMVIIGYVQADSSADETSFEATDVAKWAKKNIWPRLEKAKNE